LGPKDSIIELWAAISASVKRGGRSVGRGPKLLTAAIAGKEAIGTLDKVRVGCLPPINSM
jgi:hypothetical protein